MERTRTTSVVDRLVALWLERRALFIGSFIGLTDEEFERETEPGGWTYRQVAKHVLLVEQDAIRTLIAERAAHGAAISQ